MKEIQQLTRPYGLQMPTNDCKWACYSSTESLPHNDLLQHTPSQEIYDALKQSHSLTPVAQMALLQEQ